MFYCDACATANGWPIVPMQSRGACEDCGRIRACSDVPSDRLTRVPKADDFHAICREQLRITEVIMRHAPENPVELVNLVVEHDAQCLPLEGLIVGTTTPENIARRRLAALQNPIVDDDLVAMCRIVFGPDWSFVQVENLRRAVNVHTMTRGRS